MIKLKRINNEIVKPIKYPNEDNRPIKGADIIPIWSPNIFLLGKKRSGKGTVINKIIEKCCGKKTIVHFFVSTLYSDKFYKYIRLWFKKKGIDTVEHMNIKENGVDQVKELAEEIALRDKEKEEEEAKEKKKIKKPSKIIICESDSDSEEKEIKSKYRYPDIICIFDDLSTELHAKSLVALLKKNRHVAIMNIVSTQHIHDMLPAELKQIDIWIIFKGMSEEKLEKIYKDGQLSVPFNEFVRMYEHATKEKYHFLYINTQDEEYRSDFTSKFILPEDI